MDSIDKEYSWKGRTILVVEDNETSNIYFEAALRKTHAHLLWAKNGIEAVKQVETNGSIDLILMDINMPKMDGIEATRIIKHLKPNLPVIIQTAFVLSGEEKKSHEAGCDEFITKPIRLKHLLDSIDRYIGNSKS
jgi:CheY-like chemotaxis protein